MKHLLGIQGLTKEEIFLFINNSLSMVEVSTRELKKVPALRGKTIINLFFESSTRTRASFEIAAKRLSADVINVTQSGSSVTKGETLLDTAKTLQAMAPAAIVIRHAASGAPNFLARLLPESCIINAGDGQHEHPTQALLDLLTLSQHFSERPAGIEKLKVAIVGDLRHSRVARSNIWAHLTLGNEVRLVGPPTLLPDELSHASTFEEAKKSGGKISAHYNLEEGLQGADVVMCLRMQLERQNQNFVPTLEEYSARYCISERILSKYAPDCVVLHPGPMNRGIEISSDVADGPRSLIEKQVNNGIAVRMGVLFTLTVGRQQIE